MSTPIHHFDRGKPFYPLVMNYVTQLLGYKEVAVRGLLGSRTINIQDIVKLNQSNTPPTIQEIETLRRDINSLLGPLELKSEQLDDRIIADPDVMSLEIMSNHNYLLESYVQSAMVILVMAHEIAKDEPYHDQGPLWEFLRHCRNAATHNGLFDFRRGEPRRSAVWGKFQLETSLHGTRLFKDASGNGLLSVGDPIRLLWDIEQAYPNISIAQL